MQLLSSHSRKIVFAGSSVNPDEQETQILDAGPGAEIPDLPAPRGLWQVCALIARSPPVLDFRMQQRKCFKQALADAQKAAGACPCRNHLPLACLHVCGAGRMCSRSRACAGERFPCRMCGNSLAKYLFFNSCKFKSYVYFVLA